MKLRDLSMLFIAGLTLIAFVIISAISKVLFEYGGFLIIGGSLLAVLLIKWILLLI